jgi:PHD/YefM family antitoxin component YafN of YafNO toxin-antitoxin module
MARKKIDFVYRQGRPVAVILDIKEYKEMLERLEDAADLRMLKAMRRKKLQFTRLEDFLREHKQGV